MAGQTKSAFALELLAAVKVKISGEQGIVHGRAEYTRGKPPLYLVEYKSADGRATDGWFHEDQLDLT